jgi:hypothetical protein
MSDLGQTIREIQREAAALTTNALRDEIEINLEVQDAAIRQLASIRPGTKGAADLLIATSAVWYSVLTTALYVAELATRPAPVTTIVTSVN